MNAPPAEVQLVQNYLNAVERGDDAGAKVLLADNIALHVPGRSLISGSYKGADGVLEYVHKVMQLSNGTYKQDIIIWLPFIGHLNALVFCFRGQQQLILNLRIRVRCRRLLASL